MHTAPGRQSNEMTHLIQGEVAVDTTTIIANNKMHTWSTLFGVLLFVMGLLITFERGPAYLVWTSGCAVFSILTVYRLFEHRMFVFATLLAPLTYSATILWVTNYIMEMPMSSWRAGWESLYSFPEALGVSFQLLTFFSILSNIAISFVPVYRIGRFKPLGDSYRMPVGVLTVLSGLTLLVTAGRQARDAYLITADVQSMFLVQTSSILLTTAFAFNLFFVAPGAFRSVMNVVVAGIVLIVGMNGFRFLLVWFAFVFFIYLLATRKFSLRRVLALVVGSVVGYVFLLALAYTRSIGMTFGEAFTFLLHPDFSAVYGYAGASDQINLIAQDYYYAHFYDEGGGQLLNGRTYLDAFLRLPPNAVHTAFFDTLRSQDYIIQTGSFIPDVFRKSNWTVGAHLFVEAIINFGKLGPYIVLPVLAVVLTWLEKLARKSPGLFLGYVVTAGLGCDLAWYGFAISLKEAVFAFVCGAVIIAAGRFTVRDGITR